MRWVVAKWIEGKRRTRAHRRRCSRAGMLADGRNFGEEFLGG
jgi:hypothetical protein